ncbi:PPPDE putative peptidase domain-domain-containing protein, partial [Phakopsora pachyrhizi]
MLPISSNPNQLTINRSYPDSRPIQLSQPQQISNSLFDGIWHTSVVFDNQLEVFFGQGIMTSRPGNSHIGKPLRVIDQGETMIDPVTFEDYIEGLRSSWNAQLYHLLERSCNNFSKEVLSFLNGSDVPDYIL